MSRIPISSTPAAAVAVDNNNNIWVADSDNYEICMISNGVVAQVIAGTYQSSAPTIRPP